MGTGVPRETILSSGAESGGWCGGGQHNDYSVDEDTGREKAPAGPDIAAPAAGGWRPPEAGEKGGKMKESFGAQGQEGDDSRTVLETTGKGTVGEEEQFRLSSLGVFGAALEEQFFQRHHALLEDLTTSTAGSSARVEPLVAPRPGDWLSPQEQDASVMFS